MSLETSSPTELTSKSPIQHVQKFFDAYFDGPETFTLLEEHDLDYLSNLLKNESSIINKCDKKRIRKVIKRNCANPEATNLGIQITKVTYYKPKNSGQYAAKESLQDLEGPLKNQIYKHDGYVSLDIANRGYTIVHEIAKLNGIDLPMVTEYLENRPRVHAEHLEFCGGDLKMAKYTFNYLVSNPIHKENETDFIKNLTDELINVNEIFKHPDYSEFKIGKIIEIYSNYIIQTIVKYLVLNGIIKDEFYSLNGDAIYFKPLKYFDIKEIEKHVLDKTKISVKLHH